MVSDIQRYLGYDATVRPGVGTGEDEVRNRKLQVLFLRLCSPYLGCPGLLDQGIPKSHICRPSFHGS